MEDRIAQELAMLRQRWPDLVYTEAGRWVRIPRYPLPAGWSLGTTDVVFQIVVAYPGTPPYGIYTPAGLAFRGVRPDNYAEPAPTPPPFPGTWGIFSWSPADGAWKPTADILSGPNLVNWVLGFADRFREGK